MKSLANNLLDLTRLDSRSIMITKEPCDLHVLVITAIEEASLLSDKHTILFLGTDHPVHAVADPERIQQVILNLLSNAIQHNPDGCTIELQLKQTVNEVLLTISDDGIGIPAEALPHLFDRFYRVDQSRSRDHGGAGLGLAIVKNLVETCEGSIEVESAEGKSTRFTIHLSSGS